MPRREINIKKRKMPFKITTITVKIVPSLFSLTPISWYGSELSSLLQLFWSILCPCWFVEVNWWASATYISPSKRKKKKKILNYMNVTEKKKKERERTATFQPCQFQQCFPDLKLQRFYKLQSCWIFCLTFCMKRQVRENNQSLWKS